MKEQGRKYLLQAASLLALMLLFYGLAIITSIKHPFPDIHQETVYGLGFVLVGAIFASQSYSFFANKGRAIQFLQLPASATEKLALSFLISIVFYAVMYLLIFKCVDLLMCGLYDSIVRIPTDTPTSKLSAFQSKPYELISRDSGTYMIMFLFSASLAHFGSLLFRKNAFVKSAILTIAIMTLLGWANFVFAGKFYGTDVTITGDYYAKQLLIGQDDKFRGFVYLPEGWKQFNNVFLPGVLLAGFWIGSFFKIKEKQA
ncbi:MAG: hypothetical protein EOP49_25950 [Sphingobacteriales bacterium]|nr:MAG: hypothetical protein EOP49_25950 [Sphingobacteriales bacterium]